MWEEVGDEYLVKERGDEIGWDSRGILEDGENRAGVVLMGGHGNYGEDVVEMLIYT